MKPCKWCGRYVICYWPNHGDYCQQVRLITSNRAQEIISLDQKYDEQYKSLENELKRY